MKSPKILSICLIRRMTIVFYLDGISALLTVQDNLNELIILYLI